MYFRFRRVMSFVGMSWIFAGAAMLAIGCGSLGVFGPFNPFLAARFNTTLTGVNSPGTFTPQPGQPGTGTGTGGTQVIESILDLPMMQRTIQVSILNESEQSVRFSMTFAVSAGPGGFVPDSEIQDYLNAGYNDAILPGSGGSVTIGCDTLTLNRGTRLLTLSFGVNQGDIAKIPPNVGGDPNATLPTFVLRRRDNSSANLPLPELIIFGNSDPDFECLGGATVGDLCTQRGFVYTSIADLPVGKSVEASRIQGTVCAQNFGTAPEWRLDTTLDNQVQPFQYGRGGTIVANVLNRSDDAPTETRNQVVWTVTDANGTSLHFPDR